MLRAADAAGSGEGYYTSHLVARQVTAGDGLDRDQVVRWRAGDVVRAEDAVIKCRQTELFQEHRFALA